jgi:glycosyltransferase involved in cell wall biosynthesis
MTQRTKLLLIIPHLGGGGAERVVAHLALYLNPEHFEIHLCLVTKESYGVQPIPRWVQVHRLQRRRVRHACFQLIRLIRTERPDVVLSGMSHLNFLILLLKPFLNRRVRILIRQNTTASVQTCLTRIFYRYLYPFADIVICQSGAMAADLAANFGIAPSKLAILANPIQVSALRAASLAQTPDSVRPYWPRLLAVSRLAPEKGLDLLLRAVKEVSLNYPQVHLQILGVGPEEAALKKLAVELEVESSITFSGYRDNLTATYAEATLFVLPSRYEGLPNALLEAAAAGLPLVATPCSAGVIDLLNDASGAWLASAISSESLAAAILAALPARPDTSPRFQHAFLAPFEIETSIAAYAALIQAAADRSEQ